MARGATRRWAQVLMVGGVLGFVLPAGPAMAADRETRPQSSLSISAWAPANAMRLGAVRCKGRSPARVLAGRCSADFKRAASRRLCSRVGRGRHQLLYAVGNQAEVRSALVLCL